MAAIGIVKFPGSSGYGDAEYAFTRVLGHIVKPIHYTSEAIRDIDLLVIPGGSSFGDYLRPGALSRLAPIAPAIRRYARDGKVLGIGNGFQILCELGILRGRLMMNKSGAFMGRDCHVKYFGGSKIFSAELTPGTVLQAPIACSYGSYFADKRALRELEEGKMIAFRFCDSEGMVNEDSSITGSSDSIAGLGNADGNVLGIIFHPERAVDPLISGVDGKKLLSAIAPDKLDL